MNDKHFADLMDDRYRPARNREDLNYFLSLQENLYPDSPQYTASRWDRRAELWKEERRHQRKDDDRAAVTAAYLLEKGILTPQCSVADIGCGPGRFAAAFARIAHSVVGFDLSEKMVDHGNAYLSHLGLENARLLCRDFKKMDIRKDGWEKAFDLVFASMTPAVHSLEGLQKAMDMSRGWCMNVSQVRHDNLLREQMLAEVFHRSSPERKEGQTFYALFNILFLMGYEPETSFSSRKKVTRRQPDEEYAAYMMEHALPLEEHTPENAGQIQRWLETRREEDGLLTEVSEAVYGRILWDVRSRRERPDYRGMLK